MKDMQNLKGILDMSGSDSQVMKLRSQLRSTSIQTSIFSRGARSTHFAPQLRIEPPKPVVAKSEIEVKSQVDWLCALRNFDSLISQAVSTGVFWGSEKSKNRSFEGQFLGFDFHKFPQISGGWIVSAVERYKYQRIKESIIV
jgi:hypothetical protein